MFRILFFVVLLSSHAVYASTSKITLKGLEKPSSMQVIKIESTHGTLEYKCEGSNIEFYKLSNVVVIMLKQKNSSQYEFITKDALNEWRYVLQQNNSMEFTPQMLGFEEVVVIFPDGSEYSLVRHALQF